VALTSLLLLWLSLLLLFIKQPTAMCKTKNQDHRYHC